MTSSNPPQTRNIDLTTAKQRLALGIARTEEALHPSRERTREILDERARRLARPLEAPRPQGPIIEALIFALGNEQYGIETRYVREVLRVMHATAVPAVPDFVLCVVNCRGEILPVFDFQRLLNRASPGLAGRSHAIVCGETRPEFALIVDSAHEVMRFFLDELLPDAGFLSADKRAWLKGITRSAASILDGAELLRDRRFYLE